MMIGDYDSESLVNKHILDDYGKTPVAFDGFGR